jgi:hypothetical protein
VSKDFAEEESNWATISSYNESTCVFRNHEKNGNSAKSKQIDAEVY